MLWQGELAQDGGARGSRGGGEVSGAAVPREPGQKGKGGGFLGLGRVSEFGGGAQGDPKGRKTVAEVAHQGGVVDTPARHEALGRGVQGGLTKPGQDEAGVGVEQGPGGENGGGGDDIGVRCPLRAAEFEEAAGEGESELLSTAGFWRRGGEVGVAQEGVEDLLERSATARSLSVAVIFFLVERGHQSVDDHIGGTGIEGKNGIRSARAGDGGDVGDAAEVDQNAIASDISEEDVVEHRDERRALPTRGKVGGSEVGHDGDAEALGEEAGLSDLPGGAGGYAEILLSDALMVQGLAVTTDEVGLKVGGGGGLFDGIGVERSKSPVKARELGDCNRGTVHRGQDGSADSRGVGDGRMVEQLQLRGILAAHADAAEGNVDAIGGGAGHDASDDHGS